MAVEIITIETPSLGDRSYVLVAGGEAAVIDPQRDIDRVESVLQHRDVRLTDVFETHVHNDYVSGGLELARRTGADYVLAADDDVSFERVGARDGDEFKVGDAVIRAEVWVHCATGYRAAIAASLLDRAGRSVVAVHDDWAAASKHPSLRIGVPAADE